MPLQRTPEKSGSDTELQKKGSSFSLITQAMKNKENTLSEPNISSKNKRKRISEPPPTSDDKNELLTVLTSMNKEQDRRFTKIEISLKDLKDIYIGFEKSIDFLSSQYEDMKLKVENVERKILEKDKTIATLQDTVENLQRSLRVASVEIRNVPSKTNESKDDLVKLVQKLSDTLKINIPTTDVKDIFRIPGKPDANKPIITEFANTMTKIKVLKAVKTFNAMNKNNKLNASHLGVTGKTTPVFVTEHLTSKANRLYFLARDLQKIGLYKFCWTSNGKVFVRKTLESSVILIKSEEQIAFLKSA